jgi:hypothetical protein
MLTEYPVLGRLNKRYQLDLGLVIIGDHDFLTLLHQSYMVHAVPEETVAQQQAQFTALLRELGQASAEALRAVLAARSQVESDPSSRRTLWHSSGRV